MIYVIGVPTVESVYGECYGSHMALAIKSVLGLVKGPDDTICPCSCVGVYPHARARNFILEACKENKADRLLFVDADMLVPPMGLIRLAAVMDETKAQVVTGLFYMRGYPFSCTWSRKQEDGSLSFIEPTPDTGLIELDATGLAFTLVDVNWVLENLESPPFSMAVMKGLTLWEDGDFCHKVKAKGGTIIGDTFTHVGHMAMRQVVSPITVVDLRINH